jgi:hypothetical protein
VLFSIALPADNESRFLAILAFHEHHIKYVGNMSLGWARASCNEKGVIRFLSCRRHKHAFFMKLELQAKTKDKRLK